MWARERRIIDMRKRKYFKAVCTLLLTASLLCSCADGSSDGESSESSETEEAYQQTLIVVDMEYYTRF